MIEELLKALPPTQYKQLRYAFEEGLTEFIELDDGIFVGVNVEQLTSLKIIEQVGDWAYGEIL